MFLYSVWSVKAAQRVITTDRSKSADKTGWDSGKEMSLCPRASSSWLPLLSLLTRDGSDVKRKQDHCDLSLFSKIRTFWSLFESPGCIICEFKTYIWVKWEFSVFRPGDWRVQLKMRGGENPVKGGAFWPWATNEQQMSPIFCKVMLEEREAKKEKELIE